MKFSFAMITAFLATAHAASVPTGDPTPSAVGVTVDGDISEWNLDTDTFKPMYEAGMDDKEYASKAYYRSDCTTNTLCILVKMEPGTWMEPGSSWFKDYGIMQSEMIGDIVEYKNDAGVYVGWEGCFKTSSSDDRSSIEIHANYANESGGGRTTSTGKKSGTCASMDISCDEDFGSETDTDQDSCPDDAEKTEPGQCGCGASDVDSDSDNVPDCNDDCPDDAEKTEPGQCGCGNPEGENCGEEDPEPEPQLENDDPEPGSEPEPEPADTLGLPDGATRGSRESGGGYGDPHLKTWKGITYDFHGACDLVLVKSEQFHKGTGLEIQIRTEIRRDWSFIASTAIKIGDDVLEVGARGAFVVNGIGAAPLTESADLPSIGGFPVKYTHFGTRRHRFQIDIGDKQKLVVKVYNEFLAVSVDDAEEEDFGDAVGMMGNFDTGELVGREGEHIISTTEFGFDWQIRDTEAMIFAEVQGPQYPTHCRMPSPQAIKRRKRRLSESMVSYDQAEKACADWEKEARESCIYDVLSTGDLTMADAGAI